MGKCFDTLEDIWYELNKRPYGTSYENLDNMYITGELDEILEKNNIPELFSKEVINFIDLLYGREMENHPNRTKIKLHESEFAKIFDRFGYILSLYTGSKDSYDVLPVFLYNCIKKLDLVEYAILNDENIYEKLYESLDLYEENNLNSNRHLIKFMNHHTNMYTDYTEYQEKIDTNTLNTSDRTEFFICSEYWTYKEEIDKLKNAGLDPQKYVRWVSKDHGDGYGYDVLSYDPETGHEKIIEVKSGKDTDMELTKNEYLTMYNYKDNENVDYYIYKYVKVFNDYALLKLKYDNKTDTFVDTVNGYSYYTSPYFYYKDGCEKIGFHLVYEKEYKKMLQK